MGHFCLERGHPAVRSNRNPVNTYGSMRAAFVILHEQKGAAYKPRLFHADLFVLCSLSMRGTTGAFHNIISREEALQIEPGLNPELIGALYAPDSGIINPWEYALAMAETAVRNGVEIKLSTRVTGITPKDGHFVVETSSGTYESRYIINAGGAFSAQVYELVGGTDLEQTNFCGQYYVLDKN